MRSVTFVRLAPAALCAMLTFSFVACGDDDSSSGYVHKNDTSASCEVDDENCECEDDDCDVSSSSKKTAASSSAKEKNDSSSAKSSSSTGDKNSDGESSPASSSVKSSSSGTFAGTNSSSGEEKRPCSEEGKTQRANGVKVICHDGFWVPESSSSAVPTSSYFDMTNQFNEKVSYGEFTDPRDGHKYRTVSKYDDVFEKTYVFFAENLNYGKMVSGGTVQGDSTKYCYDDDPWYCENGWGGLYTWSNAMNFPAVCDSVSMSAEACSQKFVYPSGYTQPQYYVQHQGICPEGWHVASEGEWAYLQHSSVSYLGSKVAGFGNNGSGLSILPTGYWLRYENGTTTFKLIKKQTFFWSPEQSSDYPEKAHLVSIESQGMNRLYEEAKSKRAFPVRCVKNY
ncbi:MAG: hypothetical protein MJY99_09570 [Fibrobacter sp.]|nr:hypothetical protein [Fibrobacter sp.]